MTDFERTEHRTCVRGCTVARRHLAACEDRDACWGCQPRTAEHGLLCYPCHSRLVNLLEVAAGQVLLLRVMAGHAGEVEMSSPTVAKLGTGWRVGSDEPWATLYAKAVTHGGSASEPLRVTCVDLEREIEDRIALWVVNLINDYRMNDVEAGVKAGAEFLLRQVERLEYRPGIGDECEEFFDIMSRAHSAAPWRDEPARLRGIPCPECTATTLAMFGGDSDVTCIRCKATMPHSRYLIWAKILADEQKEAAG